MFPSMALEWMRNPNRRGEWVEMQFMLAASSRGLVVSRPWGHAHLYDFIVDYRGLLLRVQVKGTTYRSQSDCWVCPCFTPSTPGRIYTPAEVDFIAAYIIPRKVWYIIPVTQLQSQTNVVLNPSHPRSKYLHFKEAWHLLRSLPPPPPKPAPLLQLPVGARRPARPENLTPHHSSQRLTTVGDLLTSLSIERLWRQPMVRLASKSELLPGTLDMLILKTLTLGRMHGYGIAQRIQQVSREMLQIEEGSLYPALQRLLVNGWVEAEWGTSENNRRARFYELTPAGRRQLGSEIATFQQTIDAIFRVLETT